MREIQEELDVALSPDDIVWEKVYPAQKDPNQKAVFMVARVEKDSLKNIDLREGQKWELFDQKDFFESDDVIEALKGRFRDYLNAR